MSLDLTRTVLLWDPADPKDFDLDVSEFRALGVNTLEIPYASIGHDPDLVGQVAEMRADSVIFTRNDEMTGRPPIGHLLAQLRMGYTSISGIDRRWEKEQTKECIKDFLSGKGRVDIPLTETRVPVREHGPSKGTFSIILDFEQLGCARFGLPRLLPLLESAGIRATFFITGFMAWLYPEVLERIVAGGHEVGAHGSIHEFLHGRPFEEQMERIGDNVRSLADFGIVSGANFLYRMDAVAPRAMIAAGLKYFVNFRQHAFYRSRFMDASCLPRQLRTSIGDITMIPISAETYAGNYGIIRGMIDSAWKTAVREGVNHISVLMHPFKDGCTDRLSLTKQILKHLTEDLRLEAATLNSLPPPDPVAQRALRVGYRWHGYEPSEPAQESAHPVTRSWWTPVIYHSRRTEMLVDALKNAGCPSVLSAEISPPDGNVRIFPDRADGSAATVFSDPMVNPGMTALSIIETLQFTNSFTVAPPSFLRDCVDLIIFHLPRSREDTAFCMRKLWTKLKAIFCSLGRK